MKNILKRSVALSMLALFVLPAQAKPETKKELAFYVSYRLELAADGAIEKLELRDKKLATELSTNFEKQIRSWKFTAGSINGVAQRTETSLWLSIEAKPNAEGNYDIRVSDASTGAFGVDGVLTSPRYPVDELRRGNEAVLRLKLSYDADGKVLKAERPGEKIKGIAAFEKASIEAASNWRFKPERIAGVGVPGTVMVPISFCLGTTRCAALLSGSKEKEKLAREVAAQVLPTSSLVSIQRGRL